jgi:hypothetical protein
VVTEPDKCALDDACAWLRAQQREPRRTSRGFSWWRLPQALAFGPDDPAEDLPAGIFDALEGGSEFPAADFWRDYPTHAEAVRAAARAIALAEQDARLGATPALVQEEAGK